MKAWRWEAVAPLALAAALLMAGPAHSQTHGGTGVLKIKPGARATGMGQAGVAFSQRGQSIWWNPALLARNTGFEVSSTIVKLVPDLADDVYYLNIGLGSTVQGWGGIGFDLMYLSYGQTEAVDESGQSHGFFSSYELVPTLGFGTRLIGEPATSAGWGSGGLVLDVGIALKYVWVDLAPDWAMSIVGENKDGRADAVAVDIGGLFEGSLAGVPWALGVNVQNLGSKLVYIDADQGDPLPRNLKAGLAAEFYGSESISLTGVFDFNKSLISYKEESHELKTELGWAEMKQLLNMGAEISIRDRFNGRIGYVHDPEGEIKDLTFGFGLDLPIAGGSKVLRFDYSSVPQALDLNRVSYLTVGVLFQ